MPALAAPPQVNLWVEMRAVQLDEVQAMQAQGSVVVGTRGGTAAARGDVIVRTAREAGDDTAQVLVLNGGSASLRVGRLLAMPTAEWVWGGVGAGVAQERQWIEVGRGFQVRPAWPGGDAPVSIEISAEAAGRTTVQTRLALPTGEWATFARAAQTALQVRVSAPAR
jgi:hypothetical protein